MKPRSNIVTLTVFLFTVMAFSSNPAIALEWKNLWTTPDQRAKKQLDGKRYDELVEQAPSANWKAIGEYRNGDYASAIESFSQQRATAELAGSVQQAEQAMYNQANAQTLNENYSEAISLFDELLESNPEHADASHNRAIAKQLLEQQQQEQQQEQQENSEDQQEGDQSEDQQEGDQQDSDQQEKDQQDSDQQKKSEQSSDQQDEEQQQSDKEQNSENAENTNDGSELGESDNEQKEQDEQAARAMQAEQEKAQSNKQLEDEAGEQGDEADGVPDASPLTEKEQANEQWLRQIPDDPAGLLQRKLQNRHMTDFPKVKDSVEPW